ncbi:DUF5050 domain-containing protein [Fusibacter ferrireducens]|uniref:DUF5050 domain-containing protein n=1 Tax=Fusibacter ferrireducens TaxID=2785058 RepID=A0ABR9ZZW6_9FIRM|nr:DUF5050 domain-containing protein [Fusibacter ferrireducens]MBF4695996.1 DUF5050 domain-containing protein [Fusibacter ferrireducens]
MIFFCKQRLKKYITVIKIFMIISLAMSLNACTDYTSEHHTVNSNPINSVNIGFVAQSDDGRLYFQDGRNENNITQLSDSGDLTFENTYGMCLLLHDKYLYYRNFGEGAELMRLEIEHPEQREIISDINTLQAVIVDQMIYANVVDMASDQNGMYRMRLDGTQKKRLVSGGINCMQYESDYIYYALQQRGQLFRIDLNGKNRAEILWQETGEYVVTTHFIVNNGWIYFNNSNREGDGKGFGAIDSSQSICRMRVDGTEFEELVMGNVANIYSNSEEDYLLYIFKDNLYALNLNTRATRQILNERIHWVNVIDDVVYALDWQAEEKNSVIYIIDMENGAVTVLGERVDE